MKAVYYTAAELAARGSGAIPPELVSSTHLIYSSPATLAFNSPGAEGYGVKRAGLAVPGSVMLIISPGCCGRNTSAISSLPGYEDRFFYLTMDETDLVTGRHLKKIPGAVEEICRGLSEKGKTPRVVMLCITCVDALLGTDMERLCRRAQEEVPGIRVRPCYMYALTREGRKPPMVHVRQSIYELLEPRKKKAASVNLLGFFAPLEGTQSVRERASDANASGSELFALLRQAGVRTVRQIGACADYEEFQSMAEANFNLVLHPEARPAAYDLQERLGIPFIELRRFYQIDRIRAQYAALGQVLQTAFDDEQWEKEAENAVSLFRTLYPDTVFSIGEAMNGDPFELACMLVREGFAVREIFGTVNGESLVWIRLLAALSPETRIYSNLHPTMLHYDRETDADLPAGHHAVTIGRDAGWYHPEIPNVQWNADLQPYGYRAVTGLFGALKQALETGSRETCASSIRLGGTPVAPVRPGAVPVAPVRPGDAPAAPVLPEDTDREKKECDARKKAAAFTGQNTVQSVHWNTERDPAPPRGFRRCTTPFAPDQSGAVSVLYDMGGICVVCDAGGCTGNICGFDEPRWFRAKSAVFSAGLRDMDAILGRDDRLVDKLARAAEQVPADFAAIVGTPVPAVIGTDYRALCRLAAKKTGLPVLGIGTNGMEHYDRGMEKTYLALLETFCKKDRSADRSCEKKAAAEKESISANRPFSESNSVTNSFADGDYDRADHSGKCSAEEILAAGRVLGIWGYSPLDFAGILTQEALHAWAGAQGYDTVVCCGAGTDARGLRRIAAAEKNIVLSPAGTAAARWLEKEYGTPWEYGLPDIVTDRILEKVSGKDTLERLYDNTILEKVSGKNTLERLHDNTILEKVSGRRILVVHQQVLAGALADVLRRRGLGADAASFFMMDRACMAAGDVRLREEADLRTLVRERGYDTVLADRALAPLLAGLPVRVLHLPHFAVSGTA